MLLPVRCRWPNPLVLIARGRAGPVNAPREAVRLGDHCLSILTVSNSIGPTVEGITQFAGKAARKTYK